MGAVSALAANAAGRNDAADRMAADPQRPRFHFLPPANWMNDPNGPIFWKGKSHVFYQYNPNGAFSGTKHWGHAVTEDLVHWKNLPVALAPTPGGPDKDGVYTGCVVVHEGTPTLVFTGVRPEVQMIATSKDPNLVKWEKYSGNPVISSPPPGHEGVGFRDPCVWKEADAWYMVIGSGVKDVGGTALLYKSDDLRRWEYLHPLTTGKMDKSVVSKSLVATGEMWECPEFFPLGDKHVLLLSTMGTVVSFLGTYKDHKFAPEWEGRADFGCDYAPKTMLDGAGRRIWWGWIRERRSVEEQKAAGWSGVMSLPRILSLAPDGSLRMNPAPELQRLRAAKFSRRAVEIEPDEPGLIQGVAGDCLEIAAEFEPGHAPQFGLRLRSAPDGSEQTVIGVDRNEGILFSDPARSSQNPHTTKTIQKGRFVLTDGEPLKLNIFVDGSVIEVFANGRACLTERTYPTRADSLGIGIFSRGGKARLRSLDVWRMHAISPNRMTSA